YTTLFRSGNFPPLSRGTRVDAQPTPACRSSGSRPSRGDLTPARRESTRISRRSPPALNRPPRKPGTLEGGPAGRQHDTPRREPEHAEAVVPVGADGRLRPARADRGGPRGGTPWIHRFMVL